MKDVRELTSTELVAETDACQRSIGDAERIMAELRVRLQEATAELARRNRPAIEPRISDHAVLRFVERALGIDVDAIRDRILTPTIRDAVSAGATAVTIEGIKFLIKDGVIVTTIDKPEKARLKSGRKRDDDADWSEEAA